MRREDGSAALVKPKNLFKWRCILKLMTRSVGLLTIIEVMLEGIQAPMNC
jgi:hypothetical protein